MKLKNKALLWGMAALIWTIVIFSFSLQPANQSANLSGGILTRLLEWLRQWTGLMVPLDTVHNLFRKLAHFCEFFLLGVFAGNFFSSVGKPRIRALGYGGVIAFLDESLQFFTGAGRAMRFSDMLLDTFGVLAAILFLRILEQIFTSKSFHQN